MQLVRIFHIVILALVITSCAQARINKEVKYKSFVINLDKAHERLRFVSTQLKEHNIPFERFSAVNGYKVELTDLETGKKFTGQDLKDGTIKFQLGKKYFVDCGIGEEANFTYHNRKNLMSSAGEFGVSCSHRGILVEAIKQNLDVVVVFEDDIKILSNQFSFLLHSAINQIPSNSVVYLDAYGLGLDGIKRDQNIPNLFIQLPKIPKNIFGAHALVFDINAAKTIIQSDETDRQIDNVITKLIEKYKINGYILNKKPITVSDDFSSSITEMGRAY